MTIHLYLNDSNETPITSFYNVEANPFKRGDLIGLSVEGIVPKALEAITTPELRLQKIQENTRMSQWFHRKTILLVKEHKTVTIDTISLKHLIRIEYHCELIADSPTPTQTYAAQP